MAPELKNTLDKTMKGFAAVFVPIMLIMAVTAGMTSCGEKRPERDHAAQKNRTQRGDNDNKPVNRNLVPGFKKT